MHTMSGAHNISSLTIKVTIYNYIHLGLSSTRSVADFNASHQFIRKHGKRFADRPLMQLPTFA